LADAVFGVPVMGTERARPILGVQIEPVEGGVAVRRVSPESVAAAAGIRDGDVIIAAAGFAVQTPGDLQDIVARQAPGTWLPLCVRRGAQEIEIVARFPGDL
jgi:S1-C subfamily serine protease